MMPAVLGVANGWPSRRVKRLLRDYAAAAYEEDLRRALLPMAEAFKRWKRNELDSRELSTIIHEFHQGPARGLWVRHDTPYQDMAVRVRDHDGSERTQCGRSGWTTWLGRYDLRRTTGTSCPGAPALRRSAGAGVLLSPHTLAGFEGRPAPEYGARRG